MVAGGPTAFGHSQPFDCYNDCEQADVRDRMSCGVLPLGWTSAPFVHERHGLWALHVAGLDLPNRTVQMASTAKALPKRSESVLPPLHALFGSQPVLDEQQLAVRFEHATHLV